MRLIIFIFLFAFLPKLPAQAAPSDCHLKVVDVPFSELPGKFPYPGATERHIFVMQTGIDDPISRVSLAYNGACELLTKRMDDMEKNGACRFNFAADYERTRHLVPDCLLVFRQRLEEQAAKANTPAEE